MTAWPSFDIVVDEGVERAVPHVCAQPGEAYIIRVTNSSRRHIACSVTVDGENALLKDGNLIVAPDDKRELQGYLISKRFVGKEYIKEYRDFMFGKPKIVETDKASESTIPYTLYGRILCEVYEAVLDEEVDSDQELRGQTTHFRGAGLNGSFDDRLVPEGKKKHFIYSSVTVQGARSAISNSTRGRWWIRGPRKLRTLEVRYREPHALMLLGVDPKALGISSSQVKADADVKEEKKEEDDDEKPKLGEDGKIDTCDLTVDDDNGESGRWTVEDAGPKAAPVDIVS